MMYSTQSGLQVEKDRRYFWCTTWLCTKTTYVNLTQNLTPDRSETCFTQKVEAEETQCSKCSKQIKQCLSGSAANVMSK